MNCSYCKTIVNSPVHCIGCLNEIYCSAYCQHYSWESGHFITCSQNSHPAFIITGTIKSGIQTINIDDYERVPINGNDVLGNGAFGTVVRVRKKQNGVLYAMKIILKSNAIKHHILSGIQAEIETQSKLSHQNIVGFEGWAEDIDNIYCVMELANGSLYRHYIKDIKTEEQIKDIFLQVCYGLYFIHSNGYVHRDIKPENILMKEGFAKISDFGCSSKLNSKQKRACGTLEYIAPEVYEHKCSLSYQIDIYSLGVLLYELYHKHTPFKGKHQNETISLITSKVQPRYSILISTELKDLISKLVDKTPANRPTWNQIFTHAWLTGKSKLSCRKIGEIPCMVKRKVIIDDEIEEEDESKFLSSYYKIGQPSNHSTTKSRFDNTLNSTISDYSGNQRFSSFQHACQSSLFK